MPTNTHLVAAWTRLTTAMFMEAHAYDKRDQLASTLRDSIHKVSALAIKDDGDELNLAVLSMICDAHTELESFLLRVAVNTLDLVEIRQISDERRRQIEDEAIAAAVRDARESIIGEPDRG